MFAIHLVYGLLFREALAADELKDYILELPAGIRVEGVTKADVKAADRAYWIVIVIQAAGLVALLAPARRVLEVDESGGVPTVPDALRHATRGTSLDPRLSRTGVGALLGGAGLAVAAWWLAERAGLLVIEPLADDLKFITYAAVRAGALGLAAPLALGAAVETLRSGRAASPEPRISA